MDGQIVAEEAVVVYGYTQTLLKDMVQLFQTEEQEPLLMVEEGLEAESLYTFKRMKLLKVFLTVHTVVEMYLLELNLVELALFFYIIYITNIELFLLVIMASRL